MNLITFLTCFLSSLFSVQSNYVLHSQWTSGQANPPFSYLPFDSLSNILIHDSIIAHHSITSSPNIYIAGTDGSSNIIPSPSVIGGSNDRMWSSNSTNNASYSWICGEFNTLDTNSYASFMCGQNNRTIGYSYQSLITGQNNTLSGNSFAGEIEGANNTTLNSYESHNEGQNNTISGGYVNHTEGEDNRDSSTYGMHEEGESQRAYASQYGHLEGDEQHSRFSYYPHMEGESNTDLRSQETHLEGYGNYDSAASIDHLEGENNSDYKGFATHLEGYGNLIRYCHYCHIEGSTNYAGPNASYSSVGGFTDSAKGQSSYVYGVGNVAHYKQTIIGTYATNPNLSDTTLTPGQALFKIGNGTSDTSRSDAFKVTDSGNGTFSGRIVATNISSSVSGPINTILSSIPVRGVIARPTDVISSSLQSDGTKWFGSLGYLTLSQANSLVTTYLASGVTFQLSSTSVPSGYVPMCWNGTKITPSPGSVIAMEIATPLAYQNGGFTAGVLTQLYASGVIGDIFLPDTSIFDMVLEGSLSDLTNPSSLQFMGTLSGATPAWSSAVNYVFSIIANASASATGFTPIAKYFRRIGANFLGGAGNYIGNAPVNVTIGSFNSGSTRFYTMVKPSAVTNQVNLYYYTIHYVGGK